MRRTPILNRPVSGGQVNASVNLTATLIPRYKYDPAPNSNLAISVIDSTGAPLPGTMLNLTLNYPDGRQRQVSRQLGMGTNDFVHLEVPAYFDYLLPEGAPLPPCDPRTTFTSP